MRDMAAGGGMLIPRRALNDWGHSFNILFDAWSTSHWYFAFNTQLVLL